MSYREAKERIKKGECVTRAAWGKKEYVRLIGGRPYRLEWDTDAVVLSFAPTAVDLYAEDWETRDTEKGKAGVKTEAGGEIVPLAEPEGQAAKAESVEAGAETLAPGKS
jgi:hypothetical protein